MGTERLEPLRILMLEDVPTDAEIALRELRGASMDFVSVRVDNRRDFERALAEFRPDLILSDFSLPSAFDGLTALDLARKALPDIPYVFISGTIGEDRAVEAMKRGAADYVLKDRLNRLVPVVTRALQEAEDRRARRNAEEEVEAQRAFLRQVIDLDRNFIFAKDREGRFVLANEAVADVYGTTVEAVLGKTEHDVNPNRSDVEHFRRDELEVMDTLNEKFIPEEKITDAQGRVRWLQTVKRPIVGANGRAELVLGVSTDITERKRNEEALRDSEQRLDLALEASDLATWDWDIGTGNVRFSRHWWRILGYEPDEIPLRVEAWERLTHPDDLARVKAALAAHLKGSASLLDIEYRMRAKSGEWRWIRTVGRVIERDAAGRALRKTGTHGDVTGRKLQEQRIMRLSRIHVMLSGINSVIVRVTDRRQLFADACRIAVEHGGFKLAWIGMVHPETLELRADVWRGQDGEYLADLQLSARDDLPGGQGTTGLALRSGRTLVINDIANDPRSAHAELHLQRGFRAMIVLPLVLDDKPCGVMKLYATETNVFDEEEIKLLEELASDISFALDHIAKSERLDYLAYYDGLTGLANRKLLDERVTQMVRAAHREGGSLAIAVLDVERFGNVNETLGVAAGDELLRMLGARLAAATRELDTVARVGGDQFAVALRAVRDEAEIAHVIEHRLLAALREPFRVHGEDLMLPVNAGVAVYPNDGEDAEDLFVNAEAALMNGKRSGERLSFYAPQMNARVADQLRLENELRRAIQRDQFVLHYQSRVDLASGRVCGLEALLRWAHPERGLVLPGEFIPLLEQTGMILEVGAWALRRAMLDRAAWHAKGLNPPRVAVNVSQMQLGRRDFVESVCKIRESAGAVGVVDEIDIEITESMLLEDVEATIAKLEALRELGVRISLDDFGTGYSSLSYLARLPIDALKIDRSFVSRMQRSAEQMAIVSTVISLGHALNMKVVAEGVETAEQANLLRLLRCDEAQGYLYNRPLPPADVEALLEAAGRS